MNSDDTGPVLDSLSRIWWLVLIAAVAGGVGFLLGFSLGDGGEGRPPAIDFTREVGLALPIEQQPAFADGVITRPEVEEAIERLTECADEGGVTGFVATLDEDGIQMEYSGEIRNVVTQCRIKHFEAMYMVWSHQEWSGN